MKTIKLVVEVEVDDDYIMDEPEWTLEDAFTRGGDSVEIVNVYELGEKNYQCISDNQ